MEKRRPVGRAGRLDLHGHKIGQVSSNPRVDPLQMVLARLGIRRNPAPPRKDVRHQIADALNVDRRGSQQRRQLRDGGEDPVQLRPLPGHLRRGALDVREGQGDPSAVVINVEEVRGRNRR
jgi:hypothetical protein